MKRLFTLAFAIVALAVAIGARNAADLFVECPMDDCMLVDSLTRLDMLDYYRAGSSVPSKNISGGDARVLSETPNKIEVQLADSVFYSVSLVTSSPTDTIVCVVKTLSLPIKDSYVDFYDTQWLPIRRNVFNVPGIAQWFPDKNAREKARDELPFITVMYDYNPETMTIVAVPTIKEYFHPSDMPASVEALPSALEYRWNGKIFKPVK